MISRVAAFALFVALAACAGPSRTSDDRLTPMVGGGEASLMPAWAGRRMRASCGPTTAPACFDGAAT